MDGSYAEASAKKKKTAMAGLVKGLLIALTVFLLGFGTVLFGLFGIVFAGLSALACYFVFPYLNVEYEYVYCDGQIDFDKIMNGEKRKQLYRTDLDNAVVVCPADSHELDGYKYNKAAERDYTSRENGRRVYAIVETAGEQNTILYFEPNEKMLGMIKQKVPRKFKEY